MCAMSLCSLPPGRVSKLISFSFFLQVEKRQIKEERRLQQKIERQLDRCQTRRYVSARIHFVVLRAQLM